MRDEHGTAGVAHSEERVARLACLMGCTEPTVENMSRSHPGLLDVPEPHVVGCLLTLRQLLPHVDVAQLVGTTPDLLLRPDAMDKARSAVQVCSTRPHTPLAVRPSPAVA
jgi:hypothetical protein